MGYRNVSVLGIVAVALPLLAACGQEDGGSPGPGNGGTSATSADCEGDGELFHAGMAKLSEDGAVQVVLVKSDVAPPAQLVNTWTLEPKDSAGNPLMGAAVTASFLMPAHAHPARVDIGRETQPGVYEVAPYFSMPGLWKTTITVVPAGGTAASVVFSFCIPPD